MERRTAHRRSPHRTSSAGFLPTYVDLEKHPCLFNFAVMPGRVGAEPHGDIRKGHYRKLGNKNSESDELYSYEHPDDSYFDEDGKPDRGDSISGRRSDATVSLEEGNRS